MQALYQLFIDFCVHLFSSLFGIYEGMDLFQGHEANQRSGVFLN